MSTLSMGINLSLRDMFTPGLSRAERAVQGFREGMRDANRDLNDLTRPGPLRRFAAEIEDVSGSMAAVGAGVMAVGIGIGAVLGKAANTAAEFEYQLSSIKAISGATAEEMKKLENQALEMGAKTKFSGIDAAQGQEELLKAGLTVTQVLEGGLQGALDLAAAGEIELAEAAEIAATALNAFKADQLSVAQAGNILAGAANASATDVKELKYGLSMVASVAAGVGLSFQDTNTALAVFAQNGLKGSDAGTSLKTMLMNLVPKTDEQYRMMQKLGLLTEKGTSAFFDQNGKLKDMASIAGMLKKSMAGLNEEQRLVALGTMFGSDAIRAGNILFKEGADGVKNMWAAMSKVTAAEVAAERMNNFKGSFEELKGAVETGAIALGMVFLPTMRSVTEVLTKAVERFNNLSDGQKRFIAIGAAVTAGLFLIAGPMLLLIGFLPNIIAGFTAMGTAFGFIRIGLAAVPGLLRGLALGFRALLASNPIGWILLGVTLLVTGLIRLYQTNEVFRAKVDAAWNWLKGTWDSFTAGVSAGLATLPAGFKAFTDGVMGIFNDFIGGIKDVGSRIIDTIINGIKSRAKGLYNTIKDVLGFARKLLPFSDAKEGPFSNLTGSGRAIVSTLAEGVKGNKGELNDAISGAFSVGLGPIDQPRPEPKPAEGVTVNQPRLEPKPVAQGPEGSPAPAIPKGAGAAGGPTIIQLTAKIENKFEGGVPVSKETEEKANLFADQIIDILLSKLSEADETLSGLSMGAVL